MTINALKKLFAEELKRTTDQTEIDTFFAWLAEAYLGLQRIEITLNPDREISELEEEKFKNALKRLKNQEPLQYILGETEFFGLSFNVNKHVLIPRPETEELVEWVLKDLKNSEANKIEPLHILDIGTGSGCIAISLAKHLKKANVSALDISPEALEVAKTNATLNNVSVRFFEENILNYQDFPNSLDVIVSNPPYVRELEKAEIQANVLNFEPGGALFVSDQDPLIFYKKIVAFAEKNLATGGSLYFEINEYLAEEMQNLVAQFQFESIELRNDHFGKPRMLKAIKK